MVPVPGEFVEHGQAHRQDVFWHGHPGRDEIPERVTRGLGSEALQQLDVSGLLEAVVLAQGPDEHTSHLAASARTALSTTAQLCRAPPRASHHRPPSRSHGQCAAADDEHRTTFDGECRSDRPGLEAVTSSRRRLARASSASATGASTPRSAATAGSSTLNPLSITARTSTQAVTLHCAGSPRIAAGSGTFALCRAGMPPTQTEAAVDFEPHFSHPATRGAYPTGYLGMFVDTATFVRCTPDKEILMNTHPDETGPGEAVVAASRHLFTSGVMSHAGHANLSARVGPDRFALTTTGMVRDLRPDQVATVDLDGNLLEGSLAPENAEIVSMHAVIYRARVEVGGIIHTHSPAATTFAVANKELPCRAEPLLRFGQAEPVPIVPWGPRGSDVSVRGIAAALNERPTTSAVLLANHGLLVFGADPMAAARLVVAIEEAAEAELAASGIGGAVDFPPGALEQVRASMARVRS